MKKKRRVIILEVNAIIAMDLKIETIKNRFDSVYIVKSFTSLFNLVSSFKPDLVIVDSTEESLPENIRKLTEIYDIPVVLLTDYEKDDLKRIRLTGCSILKKPFQKKELVRVLTPELVRQKSIH
jgi:AmiR/NasT family two-component response regulator